MNPALLSSMVSPVVSLLMSLLMGASAPFDAGREGAGVPTQPDVTAMVRQAAFDPATYFPSRHGRDRSVIRIVYTGDDYAWPVYAIAVAEGCLDGETVPRDDCAGRLRARMVRAPDVPDAARPRMRGARLVARVREAGVSDADDVKRVLGDMGLEWVEADLRSCPGALETLRRSAAADWVPDAVSGPTPDDDMTGIVLHADVVSVEVQVYARLTTYRGWIAERSPAAWAVEMAAALEPCWTPSPTEPPWR